MAKAYLNPEPVPPASQLAVLPFLAAVDGSLRDGSDVSKLRITAHRAISRQGKGYLQQVCGYLREDGVDRSGVGRILPVDEGIIGAAFGNGLIWRTKHYDNTVEFQNDKRESMPASGDSRAPAEVGESYLALPFLGPEEQIVLILYADCYTLNFFADDDRIRRLVGMCRGFCRLFDWLHQDSFPHLRNFPLQKGQPVIGSDRTVYKKIQECIDFIESPRFRSISSFNYEASVA
jgi:hypothetical protein